MRALVHHGPTSTPRLPTAGTQALKTAMFRP